MWVVSNNFFSRTQVLNQKLFELLKKVVKMAYQMTMCMAAHI